MSDLDNSRSRHEALADLVNSVEAAESPAKFLLALTIERVRKKDAELAEAVRFCAIPRRFDANIIGVLRDKREDHETSERLLNGLLSHGFVLARQDGGYVYHDNTRDLLLEDWQADDEQRTQFNVYSQRLVNFYEAQHKEAERNERDLEAVAKVVQKANQARYAQLTSIVERRVVTTLLEALYHETLRSTQDGYLLFAKYFQEYEDRGRLTVCEALLNATRDYMRRLPSQDEREPLLKWMDSWEARLMFALRRFSDSHEKLRGLLDRVGDDTKLKLWVLADLGKVLQHQSHLLQARETLDEAIKLAQRSGEDLYNLPVWHSLLAHVNWTLQELDRAADAYREAIQSARENDNLRAEVGSRADLSGVLQERGEWADALDVALETLHVARTQLPDDRLIQQALLQRLMHLVALRAPHFLDTLYAEHSSLLTAMGDPMETFNSRLEYINLLQEGGQLERAENLMTKLQNDLGEYADTPFGVDVLFNQASLRQHQGRLDDSIAICNRITELASHGLTTFWNHARALFLRGLLYTERSLLPEAEHDLREALQMWEEIGSEVISGILRLDQVSVLRRRGQLSEAQQLLDQTHASLEGRNSTYLSTYHRVQAEVYRDQALWEEAHDQYQRELNIRLSLDEVQEAGRTLAELANVAGARGRYEEAAQDTGEAEALLRRLLDTAQYRPSDEARRADRENSRGIQNFFAIEGDHREKIGRARELFRSASQLSPDNVWYLLNLAYAHAELGEWGEAAQAVDTALKSGPEWLQVPALFERLAEYRFQHSAALFIEGDYEEAAKTYAENLARSEEQVHLGRLLGGWLGWGDSLLRLGEPEEARAKFEAGLSAATNTPNLVDQAIFHGRLALVAASGTDVPEVLKQSFRSFQLRSRAGQPEGASDLAREWSSMIDSDQQRRLLGEALRTLASEVASEPDKRRDLAAARLELAVLSPVEHDPVMDPAESVPIVTPIRLQADARLFSEGEETPQLVRMLETDIPAMRERLRTETGLAVPGVSIQANSEYDEGLYVLMLHEIVFTGGVVLLDERYCTDAAACRALGIEGQDAFHPGLGTEGTWVPEPDWEELEKAELPLLDPYEFMLAHLEALIHDQLGTFLGLQELQGLVEDWQQEIEGDRGPLLETALPDDAARTRLVRVLQALVDEQVPVRDLTSILETFSAVNPKHREVGEIVERVREALRWELPGNQSGRRLMGLSANFEDAVSRWVRERDGKRFLALPQVEARELLHAVGGHLAGRTVRDTALVVRSPGLRPFVRRLIAMGAPTLPVLAEGELVEAQDFVSEQIEYTDPLSTTEDKG